VTAEGMLLPCLYAESGPALTPLLRRGEQDAVQSIIRKVFAQKRRLGPAGRAVVRRGSFGG